MQQRDILKDQIEQLGRVLGKIIAEFLDLKLQGEVGLGIKQTRKSLQEQLDIDVEKLLLLNEQDLLSYLNERNLIGAHAEMIADYLLDVGSHILPTDPEIGKKYLNKTRDLYEVSNQLSDSLSLERIKKATKIEQMLRDT